MWHWPCSGSKMGVIGSVTWYRPMASWPQQSWTISRIKLKTPNMKVRLFLLCLAVTSRARLSTAIWRNAMLKTSKASIIQLDTTTRNPVMIQQRPDSICWGSSHYTTRAARTFPTTRTTEDSREWRRWYGLSTRSTRTPHTSSRRGSTTHAPTQDRPSRHCKRQLVEL